MTLLRDLGCSHVVYADTSRRAEGDLFAPISRRPKLADGEWAGYGKRLTALAERMADFGVGMAFHHHMGTIVETDEEVDRLMAATGPAVGLLYDTGHCVFSGGDPVALLQAACRPGGARPLQGCAQDRSSSAPGRPTRASCRQSSTASSPSRATGSSTIAAILAILHDAGYQGWLVCEAEQDPAKLPPLTYARLGFSNLARMALQAGSPSRPEQAAVPASIAPQLRRRPSLAA